MMSTETIVDQLAIQRLMYEYARCADKRDYKGFERVFSADAVLEFGGEQLCSLAAILNQMRALEQFTATQHRVQNVLYEVEGDSASGETYCLASHLRESAAGMMKIDMAITYVDRLRRAESGWCIAHRRVDVVWTQTSPIDPQQ